MEIESRAYKDIGAVEVAASRWKALFTPEYGGKLLSFADSETGREVLEQRPGTHYRKPSYAQDYTSAECSGFDDMFPTIDECACRRDPWKGIVYPDHGEVYSLPWEWEKNESCLHMWVYSVRFCCRLDKWIEETDCGGMRIRYQVRNNSPFPFSFLYAAHIMLHAEEGAALHVPYQRGAVCTTVFSDDERLGAYGQKVRWPEHNGMNMQITQPKSAKKGFKIYFDERTEGGLCRYQYRDGSAVTISFRGLPYLAIWANYNAFLGMYNVAVEPASASMDSPAAAEDYGTATVLDAKGTYRFALEFAVQNQREKGICNEI